MPITISGDTPNFSAATITTGTVTTLTTTTISDGTNSTSATNCIQGSAKAWVAFNGVTSPSIRASYNVSSVTRYSTGQYLVTFTNAMIDANYCFQCNAQDQNNGMGIPTPGADPTRTITASAFPVIYNYPPDTAYYDAQIFTVTIFR